MKTLLAVATALMLTLSPAAQAGNTSSNSSSNSSGGVYTRVDTIVTDHGRGRTIYERRIVRQRAPASDRRWRRWRGDDD
jgi:hypothetical protein